MKFKEKVKKIICVLIGHSNIQVTCIGYYYCSRCDEQVGDALGSVYPNSKHVVIVGHKCKVCEENFAKCTWKDKLFTPDPFKE